MNWHVGLVLASALAFSAEAQSPNWSATDAEAFIVGCARGLATPAYNDFLRRNGRPEPTPEARELAIEQAISAGPFRAMCTCVFDEIARRNWDLVYVNEHPVEVNALVAELANQKCRVAFESAVPRAPSTNGRSDPSGRE